MAVTNVTDKIVQAAGVADEIHLLPQDFAAVFGSPTIVNVGRFRAWSLANPTASARRIAGGCYVPSGWATVTVEALVANASTNSGTFGLAMGQYRALAAGHDLSATATGTSGVAGNPSVFTTAGAQHIVQRVTLASGLALTGAALQLAIARDPGASDTLDGAVLLERVIIKRAS